MSSLTEGWHAGEWVWALVAVFFAIISPVFIYPAVRSKESRKDIWTALSFTWVCWMWVGIAIWNIGGWNLIWPSWS